MSKLEMAIHQITGFASALDRMDAGSMAQDMGLKEKEWRKIKSTETWMPKKIINDIDYYFETKENK